jgi:Uma2 family endonuclease
MPCGLRYNRGSRRLRETMLTKSPYRKQRATLDELYHTPENGKAEIVRGEIVLMRPTGARPGRAATKIANSLSQHEEQIGGGYAFGDNVGFVVSLPGRDLFSPDAAWYTDPVGTEGMDFLPGAPAFAVEVRSKNDYGPKAARAIAQKIHDYFAAGTLVVWDVDTLGEDVITVHRSMTPDIPIVYRRGDIAEAEPAVPGWRMPVDKIFQMPSFGAQASGDGTGADRSGVHVTNDFKEASIVTAKP